MHSSPSTAVRATPLWPQPTLIVWAFLSGIGVALLVAGWAQVRSESVYADQSFFIAGAVANTALTAVPTDLSFTAALSTE